MSPIAAYVKLMSTFLTLATAGFLACLLITRLPVAAGASRAALRICGAIVGSVAGVFLSQLLLILPVTVLLFGVLKGVQLVLGRLDGAAQISWNITVILLLLGLFIFGTALGFIVGWGVGSRVASGASVARALARSRCIAIFSHIPLVRLWLET